MLRVYFRTYKNRTAPVFTGMGVLLFVKWQHAVPLAVIVFRASKAPYLPFLDISALWVSVLNSEPDAVLINGHI